MQPNPPSDSAGKTGPGASRRAAAWAALLIFLTAGYFQNSRPGWNVNSQFALACALAEHGTFRIDAYLDQAIHGNRFETNDRARFGGHFYSDKSPVTAMLGAPVVWLYRRASLWTGIPFHYETARWLAGWVVVGGSAAALAAMLTLLLAGRGLSPEDAARAAAIWIAATPLMGYSILFFNYVPACALLAGAFMAARPAWREPAGRGAAARLWLAGLLAGLAAWTLNTLALAALALTVLIAAGRGAGDGWASRCRRLGPWLVGGLIGVAGYFIYLQAIFGSVRSPYAYEADPFFRDQMARGLMGATWPRPLVMWLLTFHPFMGLLLWFPVVTLGVAGCLWLARRAPRLDRRESLTALAIFLLLLLYTSGYFMWWGGWAAYAPRHLIPALPLLALGLVPFLRAGPRVRAAFWIVAALCLAFNLAAVAVDPQTPPLLDQQALLRPETVQHWPVPMLRLQRTFWIGGYADRNWGAALGLRGPHSLLPLALGWCLAWWCLPRWIRPRKPPAGEIGVS